jgi:hypothetical protein
MDMTTSVLNTAYGMNRGKRQAAEFRLMGEFETVPSNFTTIEIQEPVTNERRRPSNSLETSTTG